jgi:hypothetical protein
LNRLMSGRAPGPLATTGLQESLISTTPSAIDTTKLTEIQAARTRDQKAKWNRLNIIEKQEAEREKREQTARKTQWQRQNRAAQKAASQKTAAQKAAEEQCPVEEVGGRGEEASPTAVAGADMPNAAKGDAIWQAQLVKLKEYECRHGDCTVPIRWAEDPRLGRWVMTQRGCKKALDRGDPRPKITAVRVAKLDALGFAWQVSAAELSKQNGKASRNDAGWEAQLAKLKQYHEIHGDCNVPQSWPEDPALGIWIMTQRACKRKLVRGNNPARG